MDHIIDLLHDAEDALRNCCLVSKSLIPRTRKHLFAEVKFPTEKRLDSWKGTFPDPSTSPAHYARTLSIGHPRVIRAAEGGWLRGFSCVVHLTVGPGLHTGASVTSLIPLHGFSPVIRSLRLHYTILRSSYAFGLILSFPLLENVAVIVHRRSIDNREISQRLSAFFQPQILPRFTGSLELCCQGGMKLIARRLLSLTGGLHFREFTSTWFEEGDVLLTTALVGMCSHTLESLEVTCKLGMPTQHLHPHQQLTSVPAKLKLVSADLSKAIKLKDVIFRLESRTVEWITVALQTITPKHRDLHQISIYVPYSLILIGSDDNARLAFGEEVFGQWLDLDRLLVQLRESCSLHPRVVCAELTWETRGLRDCIECLLPETAKRGMIHQSD